MRWCTIAGKGVVAAMLLPPSSPSSGLAFQKGALNGELDSPDTHAGVARNDDWIKWMSLRVVIRQAYYVGGWCPVYDLVEDLFSLSLELRS